MQEIQERDDQTLRLALQEQEAELAKIDGQLKGYGLLITQYCRLYDLCNAFRAVLKMEGLPPSPYVPRARGRKRR